MSPLENENERASPERIESQQWNEAETKVFLNYVGDLSRQIKDIYNKKHSVINPYVTKEEPKQPIVFEDENSGGEVVRNRIDQVLTTNRKRIESSFKPSFTQAPNHIGIEKPKRRNKFFRPKPPEVRVSDTNGVDERERILKENFFQYSTTNNLAGFSKKKSEALSRFTPEQWEEAIEYFEPFWGLPIMVIKTRSDAGKLLRKTWAEWGAYVTTKDGMQVMVIEDRQLNSESSILDHELQHFLDAVYSESNGQKVFQRLQSESLSRLVESDFNNALKRLRDHKDEDYRAEGLNEKRYFNLTKLETPETLKKAEYLIDKMYQYLSRNPKWKEGDVLSEEDELLKNEEYRIKLMQALMNSSSYEDMYIELWRLLNSDKRFTEVDMNKFILYAPALDISEKNSLVLNSIHRPMMDEENLYRALYGINSNTETFYWQNTGEEKYNYSKVKLNNIIQFYNIDDSLLLGYMGERGNKLFISEKDGSKRITGEELINNFKSTLFSPTSEAIDYLQDYLYLDFIKNYHTGFLNILVNLSRCNSREEFFKLYENTYVNNGTLRLRHAREGENSFVRSLMQKYGITEQDIREEMERQGANIFYYQLIGAIK